MKGSYYILTNQQPKRNGKIFRNVQRMKTEAKKKTKHKPQRDWKNQRTALCMLGKKHWGLKVIQLNAVWYPGVDSRTQDIDGETGEIQSLEFS